MGMIKDLQATDKKPVSIIATVLVRVVAITCIGLGCLQLLWELLKWIDAGTPLL